VQYGERTLEERVVVGYTGEEEGDEEKGVARARKRTREWLICCVCLTGVLNPRRPSDYDTMLINRTASLIPSRALVSTTAPLTHTPPHPRLVAHLFVFLRSEALVLLQPSA
jgi:hypothetical protein